MTNKYKRYCPNVFVAESPEEYQKNDIITVKTKYGKENHHRVHNLVKQTSEHYYYSITRLDGFNSQKRAEKKI